MRQWLSEKVTALDAEQAALEGKQMVRVLAMSRGVTGVATSHAIGTCIRRVAASDEHDILV